MIETNLQLTRDQEHALEKILGFADSEVQAFILCGYAGTGKTTLLNLINEQLQKSGRQVSLMAPTGRAAKILREKTRLEASTVHSGIYNYSDLKEVKVADEEGADSFQYFFELKSNDTIQNRVFIIDESSMISDDLSEGEFFRFGSGKLLSDLIEYTRIQHPRSNNKLIFVGDPAQLAPPTNSKCSPALSAKYLLEKFGLRTDTATLSKVVRQDSGSGILSVAQQIRQGIDSGFFNQFQVSENPPDIHLFTQDDFYQLYDTAAGKKIIISYTNQTAHQINMDIRRHKYGGDYPVRVGDVMLVGQNNHLTKLFNGEFGIINRCEEPLVSREVSLKIIGGSVVRVLLKWRKIELAYKDEHNFKAASETYMLENYLYNNANNLKPEEQQALYVDFKNRHPHLKPGSGAFKETLRQDHFFNALRLKYGFAVTCHKAQGGEWDSTFVFWDYGRSATFNAWTDKQEKTGRNNADFYRWAYTAITRASQSLYCINPPIFSPYENMAFVSPGAIPAMRHLNGEVPNIFTFKVEPSMVHVMERLGIQQKPQAIQNHFLSVLHQCELAQIEVIDWKQTGYEFKYLFRQGDKTAALKGWIKGNNSFSPTYQKIPGSSNSDELNAAVQRICQEHDRFQAEYSEEVSDLPSLSLDWSVAEQKPFLYQLYSDILPMLPSHRITITQLEHLDFRDRYTFERPGEKVVLDIEYDGQGFFGRVFPLINPTPSALLLRDLETIFLSLINR